MLKKFLRTGLVAKDDIIRKYDTNYKYAIYDIMLYRINNNS